MGSGGRQALAKGVTKGTRSKKDAYFLCVCTLQGQCCLKSLSIRHFLGVPKVVLNALLWVPWVGLELQFLELINVSTEVITILFLCKSFKITCHGWVCVHPIHFFANW